MQGDKMTTTRKPASKPSNAPRLTWVPANGKLGQKSSKGKAADGLLANGTVVFRLRNDGKTAAAKWTGYAVDAQGVNVVVGTGKDDAAVYYACKAYHHAWYAAQADALTATDA
jgi:hypothetical protein